MSDLGGVKITELSQAFARLSPTAKDSGLSMEMTAAITATLVKVLGSGEMAATTMKSGLLSLLAPADDAKEKLTAMGVSTENSNGTLKSAQEILTQLAGKWGGLGDSVKLQTAAILFGKEQAGGMNLVLGQWNNVLDYNTKLLDKNTGAVGSMAKEVQGQLQLIDSQTKITKEAWTQVLVALGMKLTVDAGGAINALGDLGKAVRNEATGGAFDVLLKVFQDVFKTMDATISAIAKNLPEALKAAIPGLFI